MSPTVTRSELNNAPDIIAETRLVPIRRRRDDGHGSFAAQHQGKQPYASMAAAEAAARRKSGLTAYRCQHCRLWHVGNRNKG